MRIHLLAMVALLTAAVATGCGSARDVKDPSTHANAFGCDQCHGYPPPPFFTQSAEVFPHAGVTGAMCYVCHPNTVGADGHSIVPNGDHRDGQIEAVSYKTAACDTCHATPPDVGRHLFHVNNRGVACGKCHENFSLGVPGVTPPTVDDTVHMQGLDYIVVEGGTHVAKQADANGDWPSSECSACHAALGVSD